MHSYAQFSCDLLFRFYILRLKEGVVFKYYVTYSKFSSLRQHVY